MNTSTMDPKLYQDEFKYLFGKRSFCVRGVLVSAAFIEGQIVDLAKPFLKAEGIKCKPESTQEYFKSLEVLETKRKLNSKELDQIEKFRKERNKAIHGVFKGMTRPQWEQQNKKVVELARPIIENLDKKLYPQG